ncbi:hypothetical protein KI688_004219 [Linnemannia hyalina]|uniref:Yeast cell wall synthesis Kre9/Knh1-like N-terminal domain-containing protein n=1 Tax=Linnemannia hyalina TaxID=64524 RepID=A0A9P7XMK4_9FUNG|nr:hypothetical protein KI688_004219 [Linnemannia hyalina]
MKTTAILAIAASTVATVASAELLKYGAPISSTVWTAGSDATISWTNTCADQTTTTFPVMLQTQRADGVQIPVAGLASLGDLDCAKAGSLSVKVPTTVPSGKLYSILVTNGNQSYSALFTIENAAIPDPSANVTTTTASGVPTSTALPTGTSTVNGTASATKPSVTAPTTSTTTKPNNAGALKTGSVAALAVAAAVAAFIF